MVDNETLWKQEARGKARFRRIIFSILILFVVFLAGCWFVITEPVLSVARLEPIAGAEPSRLESMVRALSNSPRDFSHIENLDRAAALIANELKSAGATVTEQEYRVSSANGAGTYRNVVGTLGPDTTDVIVIGAHYDACGPYPGADDNASGIAGLIELARLLAHATLSTRVELVAYSLEEPPFFRTSNMGSAQHASLLQQNGTKVRAMISLEMIGYFSDDPTSQAYPAPFLRPFYPSSGNFIAVVGNLRSIGLVRSVKKAMMAGSVLPVYSINAPGWIPGIDFSDHLNYWNSGFPAVMVTDTAFYRNKAYHTAHDTPDRLDYNKMAQVIQGVYQAIINLEK
jgi:Zn-dependent M28 family amino/carboxypeptidase